MNPFLFVLIIPLMDNKLTVIISGINVAYTAVATWFGRYLSVGGGTNTHNVFGYWNVSVVLFIAESK